MAARIDFDATLEAINGMTYTHDGIQGKIKVERINGMTQVCHEPTAKGKNTPQYQDEKSRLGDDWSTCWEGECPQEFWAAVEKRGLVRYAA